MHVCCYYCPVHVVCISFTTGIADVTLFTFTCANWIEWNVTNESMNYEYRIASYGSDRYNTSMYDYQIVSYKSYNCVRVLDNAGSRPTLSNPSRARSDTTGEMLWSSDNNRVGSSIQYTHSEADETHVKINECDIIAYYESVTFYFLNIGCGVTTESICCTTVATLPARRLCCRWATMSSTS